MKPWSKRPVEVATLLNPAFCALLLRECVKGFVQKNPEGIPYPLLALLLPIVLHKFTRELLPAKISTKMHPWLQEHQDVRIGFAQRCAALVPYYREATLFGCTRALLAFTEAGLITAPPLGNQPKLWGSHTEVAECLKQAHFVGRWFSGAGDVRTIYAMWGIRP
ncbi:MAG: three component ABC system middle component [Candidatus Korobacteraceae bacterium]|jgi:hypothetical protein